MTEESAKSKKYDSIGGDQKFGRETDSDTYISDMQFNDLSPELEESITALKDNSPDKTPVDSASNLKQKETEKRFANTIPENYEESIQFANHVHDYLNSYIGIADTKASFLVTIFTAIIALLFHQRENYIQGVLSYKILLPVMSCLLLGIAIYKAAIVVLPRLRSIEKKGFIFWNDILKYSSKEQFVGSFIEAKKELLLEEIVKHNYQLSEIASAKYNHLKWSYWVGGVGVILTLTSVLAF